MDMERQSSVTEERVGFPTLVEAQIFWASLEDPTQYHIARVVQNQLYGGVLAYLVERNKD
jgi:hypothetical protein